MGLRAAIVVIRFVYAVVRDVVAGNLTLRAMGLVYITILSVVPVIAISFSILKGFGYHRELEPLLYKFLEPMGDKGVELTDQVIGFVENIQGDVLAGVGLVLLFITTVSMAQKVEDSFNHVWRVDQSRNLAQRLSEYLSVILVGPVIMVTAIAMIAAVQSNTMVTELTEIAPIGATVGFIGKLAPFMLVVVGFTFVYWFLPNTRVRFFAAMLGGLTGGFLWAGTGVLFAAFVANSARTLSIYATFAIVIIALIWLYLCWLILLVGAQVSFYYQRPEYLRIGFRPISIGGRQREQIAFSLMAEAARAFRDGDKPPTLNSIAESARLPGLLMVPVVNRLIAAQLITRNNKDQLFPQRDPARIALTDIIAAVRDPQKIDVFPSGRWSSEVGTVSEQITSAMDTVLQDRSLYDLIAPSDEEPDAGGG